MNTNNNTTNNTNNSISTIDSSLDKKEFIENVKKWVLIDNYLKQLNDKKQSFREQKQQLSKNIIQYMKTKKIENSPIEISDGEIRLYNKKDYSNLTFTYIESCLADIIPDKSHVEYIIQYLKDHREIKDEIDIRRLYA
jgi:hypothetical protein